MALDAEIGHFLLEQFASRRPVGVVAGGAGAILDRQMDNPRFLKGLGKIRVAFQTQIPDGAFDEGLSRRLMGVMAFGTDTGSYRTVHEFLFERRAFMTPQAERCLVLAHFQQKPSGGPVRLVAGKTVTVFYRRVHHLLLPERSVARCAKRWHLGSQFPAFSTQYRVYLIFLLVTRKTIFFFYRCVRFFRANNRPVT
jgi:hypothetical protein